MIALQKTVSILESLRQGLNRHAKVAPAELISAQSFYSIAYEIILQSSYLHVEP